MIDGGRDFIEPRMAEIFSDRARIQGILDFEAALARAEARAGIIPFEAAEAIAKACVAQDFDLDAIQRESILAGNWAIPVTKALTARVPSQESGYVHWGATSQDATDTATVLQMRAGIDRLVTSLVDVADMCAALADRYRSTPMVGRTLLQQAVPITFGLKAAHWLSLTGRSIERLTAVRETCLVVQFGGAAGTLASLGKEGPGIGAAIASELNLQNPDLPWHADRDRLVEIVSAVTIAAGAAAKIAGDALLLMQSEVGELREGAAPGKGGSSTMPHKNNPVCAMAALASARLASGSFTVLVNGMVHEHERAAGAWQVEWTAVPDCFCFAGNAVDMVAAMLRSLEVDAERMAHNLGAGRGMTTAESLAMRLARELGKGNAHELVKDLSSRAVSEGIGLLDAALRDQRIRDIMSADDVAAALDPQGYLGSSETFVERALDRYRRNTHKA